MSGSAIGVVDDEDVVEFDEFVEDDEIVDAVRHVTSDVAEDDGSI